MVIPLPLPPAGRGALISPPGVPRGVQTDYLPHQAPSRGSGRGRGHFFVPGLGRGGGNSVTGEQFLLRRWAKGELWGPPTPTRAGAGVFFLGPVGPSAEESALFSGKIAVMTAETPDFS